MSMLQLPSPAALALTQASHAELERAFVRGTLPAFDGLAGWQFRGINRPAWARAAGIKKFIKGFFKKDGQLYGYNCPVVQNATDGRWHAKPTDDAPKRFGFYTVAPVDPTARDNAYLNAALLDYGKGGNGALDPTQNLRDYLVQVEPGNPDLLLGKAFYALGPARVPTNFFVLERHRRAVIGLANR